MLLRQMCRLALFWAAGAFAVGFVTSAHADEPPKPTQTASPSWQSGITLGAQIESGVVGNFDRPADGLNYGQLFTDHANQVQLNQILLTAQRLIDPKASEYDVGFQLQLIYGSDARYTHFLGELDRVTGDRNQIDVVEANVTMHLPWLTQGGIDLKLGQYTSPMGAENIDPAVNPFYSHSYIFNFGTPLKHTGFVATTYVNDTVDIYLGADSGVNTSLGAGDNNTAPAGLFGFGLNLLDGKLTLLALSHIGPEQPQRAVANADKFLRYINDLVLVYKASDKLTVTTEANYIRDDFARADGYGVAQYGQYALTDRLSLNARAELWRDNKGYFVAAFPRNLGFVDAEAGYPTPVTAASPTTYSAMTIGVTWKPDLPGPISTVLIRPELRYDRSLNGTPAYDAGRARGDFTVAADLVVGF